jgi:hypothetical protein
MYYHPCLGRIELCVQWPNYTTDFRGLSVDTLLNEERKCKEDEEMCQDDIFSAGGNRFAKL